MPEIRLLIDPAAAGAWNMAVDEAVLETAATTGQVTARFYTWDEPTLSLGYFQSIADRVLHPASGCCPLVRRASGGGAILHDRELTYSLAVPQRSGQIAAAAELYNVYHESLIKALADFGVVAVLYRDKAACRSDDSAQTPPEPFLCFQRRTCSDIVYGAAKIGGSAQRRRRGAVLQHGSVLLARSPFAPELPGVQELTGVTIDPGELAQRCVRLLADRLGWTFTEGSLLDAEHARAESLSQGRFAAREYLQRR
jgi:lipoate-protein ligase A